MSQPFGGNPYAAPGPESYPPKPVAPWAEQPIGPCQMDYFGGFGMIHRNPDWFVSILLTSLCAMIPVIGGIILNGYIYETVEILHRTNGHYYSKFDFGRFVEYLLRGVGPFLIGLLLSTALVFVILFGYFVIIASALAASAAGKDNEAAAGLGVLAAFTVVGILAFGVSLLVSFFMVPMGLRGGVSSDIGQSFNFTWAIGFIQKTWLEMILVFLFQFAVSLVAGMFVAATCYIGLIVAIGYLALISAWLQFQLYRVFLSRGGEPIPFKPAPLPMPVQ